MGAMKELTQRIERLERRLRLLLGLGAVLLAANAATAWLLFAVVLAEPAEVAGVSLDDGTRATTTDDDAYREEMRTFFERMTDVLDREARKAGVNPADVLPTDQEIDDAVETLTMHSDQSQKVLQKLREGFDYFDLTWPIAIPER